MIQELLDKVTTPSRDYTPKSNPSHFEEFFKTTIYQDFLQELSIRIEDMRDFYETCARDQYLETRGGIKAVRMVAGVFQDLYENSKKENINEENL
jgi:hypothetical protein